MAVTKRSYADSYVFSKFPDYEKNIMDFIMSSERIEKESERFSHISEDVKRRQVTAVLHRVMMDDDVVFCIHRKGMPAAFKVFMARDVKTDRAPKVFIDVTDIVKMKDGFYECTKIDVLCTYLLSAMTDLSYEREPEKLISSSILITSSTSCFVSLFTYILDYLRVNGFAENKIKIGYLAAMYYQVRILGKERDQTSKNIAIKIAGGQNKDITAYEFYYNDEHLDNIHVFISYLADTFKLNGLTTDVFLEKWLWLIGKGTQFGLEVFTAFSTILTDAYCGTYINNHKNIERCCGREMVNYVNNLIRICSDCIDRGMRYESFDHRQSMIDKANGNVVLEGLFKDNESKKAVKAVDAAFATHDIDAIKSSVKAFAKVARSMPPKAVDKRIWIIFQACSAETDAYILGTRKDYKPLKTPVCKDLYPIASSATRVKMRDTLQKAVKNISQKLFEEDKTFTKYEKETRAILKDNENALKIFE